MGTKSDVGASQQGLTWDHTDCAGTVGCPARCPRFVDKEGTPICITPGGEEEADALVDFYDEYPSRDRSMSLPPLTRPQIESWVDRIIDRGKSILAYHDGELVGHVAYLPADKDEPELIVFVASEYQNRGLGTELCRQAMAHAAEDDHTALTLHVDVDNQRALAVYQSLGFVEVDRKDKRIEMRLALDDETVDEVQAPPAARL
ncbi:GNAT family N-acetyltransferase [Salinibaculum rarum]|uniref:GNAT family N-acetyltransferase n=1 Tax=Salinibaculum rarum TaxID=3058903 RepID=UPI00265E58EC|nr:GNAT family N-acetyltransferase [Salinibaculum sp. KK48]